jgi:hypothetical protein
MSANVAGRSVASGIEMRGGTSLAYPLVESHGRDVPDNVTPSASGLL